MVFFISMCSSLLAPFRCYTHPNGQYTVQDYHSVLCDMKDEHLHMSLIGGRVPCAKRQCLAEVEHSCFFASSNRLIDPTSGFQFHLVLLAARCRQASLHFVLLQNQVA